MTIMSGEEWPGIDGWMKKKPLGMDALMGRTSERIYSKKYWLLNSANAGLCPPCREELRPLLR